MRITKAYPVPVEPDEAIAKDASQNHRHLSIPPIAAEVLAGAAAGAAIGAIAGPPGAIAGAVIGSLAAGAAGIALESGNAVAAQKDDDLDHDIGVVGGHLGEAPPGAPPVLMGAFSAGAMGVGSPPTAQPSEGPMQGVDD